MSWLRSNIEALGQFGAVWVAVGLGSLLMTVITLPIVIVQLPEDYFVAERRHFVGRSGTHPVIAVTILALKNLFGLLLLVVGAVMLFVPGQGILTMLIGLLLMNFPGKYRLERNLVRRKAVLRTLNAVRRRWGRAPLQPPPRHVE